MSVFRMPSLGSDMEAGKLVEWLVTPGDSVSRGDVIAVVETQKGAIEVEIFDSGRIARLIASLGDTLPVGAPMAELDGAGEGEAPQPAGAGPPSEPPEAPSPEPAAPRTPPPETAPPPEPAPPRPGPRAGASPPPQPRGEPPPASPAARARAAEAGLDLSRLEGSGPGGALVLADIERALAAGPAEERRRPRFDPSAMRAAVAAAMTRSKREIPHYYLAREIDLQPAADWLAATNAERDPPDRLLMALLLIRAAARAAAQVPGLNGRCENGEFRPAESVHAGVAVALRSGGLVAPALRDADTRPLDALMDDFRDLVARARTGRLRASEIADPTLTVSSLGERGADALYGVIFPPQVAIFGFGAPRLRPWADADGALSARLTVTATLSADHRVSDGRAGARCLAALADLLQSPEAP